MSAWYLMSSIGFYSVTPGTDEYVIGSPLFDKVMLKFEGKETKIIIENNSENNIHIQRINLNNEVYTKLYFNHSTLTRGNEIKIQMGNEIKRRKLILSDFPQSISKEMKKNDFSLIDILKI